MKPVKIGNELVYPDEKLRIILNWNFKRVER